MNDAQCKREECGKHSHHDAYFNGRCCWCMSEQLLEQAEQIKAVRLLYKQAAETSTLQAKEIVRSREQIKAKDDTLRTIHRHITNTCNAGYVLVNITPEDIYKLVEQALKGKNDG